MKGNISKYIFRAYDIRGVYKKDINPELFYKIGMATGNYIKNVIDGESVAVGNDIRQTGFPLAYSFISGITAAGINIIYTGSTSFGQTLFKGWESKQDVIAFITASHLPAEWNGIKFYYGNGVGFPEEDLQQIRDLTLGNKCEIVDWKNVGKITLVDPKTRYKSFFLSKFTFNKELKVALDCGGASTTLSAPDIFNTIGLNTTLIFCNPDPLFSKRPSDPKPQNLTVLIETVKKKKCDFGVAFDGDGDRAVIVDNTGKVLSADEVGIIIAKHGIANKKGTIVANVECSKAVREQLEPLGFKVKQIPVGHTFLTLHAQQENSPLGIESSGHLVLPEYFLFDDALVVPLKIAEIIDTTGMSLDKLVAEIPSYPRKKEEIECADEIKFTVVKKLKSAFKQEFKKIETLDGVRVEFENGWILIRPSNTSPIIRLTTEADNEKYMNQLSSQFLEKIKETIEKTKAK